LQRIPISIPCTVRSIEQTNREYCRIGSMN
jgi:hypothetical protein